MRFSWLFAIIGFSECEAIAAQAEETRVAVSRRFNSREEVMRNGCAVLVTLGAVMMGHGNAGASGFGNLQRRAITAEHLHRRPLGQDGNRRRRVRTESLARVNNRSAHD